MNWGAPILLPEQFNAATYFIDRHLQEGRGEKTAIEAEGAGVSYHQLWEDVNRFGNGLRKLGVRIEERVFLLLLDGPEFAISFFGAIKIGAVPVPVNTLLQQNPPDLEAEPTSKDDAAFWLYSSGSTGFPKACVHLQHDMLVCAERYAKGILAMTESDRCFSAAKLFFAYGLGNALYFPLAVGGTSILWPGPPKPQHVFDIIERHRPTLFFSVPSNYAALLAYEPGSVHLGTATPGRPGTSDFDLSSIRYGVSAGEALPAALFHRFKERFGVEILDAIGSTEILHVFIANRPGAVRPGSSGQIIPGYEAKIVNENRQPVKPGDIGNLLVKSDSNCSHYWNQHEKSKSTIEGHWIRTGDQYYLDADGYFWYVGRSDDMLKCNGVWVSPIEIEG